VAKSKLATNFVPIFARDYWRKKPGVFKGVLPDLMSDKEIMGSIRKAAEMVLDPNNTAKKVSFYPFAGGREIRGMEALKFIPSGNSVDEYFRELSDSLHGDSFGLVINGYDEVCPEVWEQLKEIVDDLVKRIGVPVNQIDCFLMLGNYQSTTFGIHLDSSIGVIALSLRGTKRMLAWPRDYFEHRHVRKSQMSPETTATVLVMEDIAQFADDAVDLQYGPGDVAYWPESYWHVGHQKQSNEMWITVSLGFRLATSLSEGLATLLEEALRERLGSSDVFIPQQKLAPTALPTEIEAVLDALDDIIISGQIDNSIKTAWAEHCDYIMR
jgi:50S ribosomal protein L16 3-hydroxylase